MPRAPGAGGGPRGSRCRGTSLAATSRRPPRRTIKGHGGRKQWIWGALAVFREASEPRAQTGIIPYSAAISACGAGRQWQLAALLLEEIREVGLEQDRLI
ncbi:unnamed protein product [Prorocentrum cordatum]|uniref:Uncharacterized protein n=1 Tax=Prorocentrum cordatum TaxID=2364126 RepID=A0ABN9RZM6_9DINO|nr:unnamed protein product [Polarella glacialis]